LRYDCTSTVSVEIRDSAKPGVVSAFQHAPESHIRSTGNVKQHSDSRGLNGFEAKLSNIHSGQEMEG
jgi:hypothetical protein